jgi:hypothetical protein
MKLVTILRSTGDKRVFAEKATPVRKKMRTTIDEMIAHMKKRTAAQPA